MRWWWADSRETTLDEPACQAQSSLNLQGANREITDKEDKWAEVVRRNPKGWKGEEKPHNVIAIQNSGTPSTYEKYAHSTVKCGEPVLNLITLASSKNGDELEYSFMDSGTSYRVCYRRNHVTFRCRHIMKETHFLETYNHNYEARFGMEGNHRKQIRYPASPHF